MTNYPIYEDYKGWYLYSDDKLENFSFSITPNLDKYIDAISSNSSHNTDKFRQALFFLTNIYLDNENTFMSIDNLQEKINHIFKKNFSNHEFLSKIFTVGDSLPPIFEVNYYFENNISDNNFDKLSSGEKQKIYSIHSIIYHLRNLKSVQETHNQDIDYLGEKEKKLLYYKNVNIIFDEIELYAHPEYQRRFINDLLTALKSINLRYDSLNILFITHSPFILSD
ncbi:hypothetical protein HAP39_20110, partial [Elizabethkingia miricola]|nr:hypothetical protein [Elizabethkingia miricola]